MKKTIIIFFFVIFLFQGLLISSFEISERENIKYYTQTNLDMSDYSEGLIKVKYNDVWKEYEIRELPDDFISWNIPRRIQDLECWLRGEMPPLAGPHSGMVASYGISREDDIDFRINNAVKGIGFLPKEDKIDSIIDILDQNLDLSMPDKLKFLINFYENADEILDYTKQISLELYTTEEFKTGTFLNIMEDPAVSIVFLDIPSYEVKAITQLIHPDDETLNQYEKNIVEYINKIHDFIHSNSPRQSIAIVFHVIEVFDNSPRARGVRVLPPMP